MRKHKLTLKTTINFRFYLLIVQVNEMIFMSSLCVCSNSKSSKTTFFAHILWLSMKGIILRKTQLFACFAKILRVLCLSLKLFSYFCKCIHLFYNNVWQREQIFMNAYMHLAILGNQLVSLIFADYISILSKLR